MMLFRLYYNRSDDPCGMWSFDHGSQASEVVVRDFELHRCNAVGGFDMTEPRVSTETPRVWVAIDAESVRLVRGTAHFYGVKGEDLG